MAEFAEVMKQKKRMCESKLSCNDCELYKNDCCSDTCEHPEIAEEIIMKWAKEHPIKTNKDKFIEVFGSEIANEIFGSCACRFTGGKECKKHDNCIDCKLENFFEEEYKEPKEV